MRGMVVNFASGNKLMVICRLQSTASLFQS